MTETTSSGEGATLQLAADPDGALRYDKTTLEAPAGKVTIVLTNDSSVEHDVAIEGNGVDVQSDLVDNGGTSEASATLTAGTYTFFCTVPGHEQAGMKGTLTVR
jgi:plastocyanin